MTNRFLSPRIRFDGLLLVGGGVVSLLTVLGFAGGMWWRFDLLSHFRVQYLAALAVAMLGLCAYRKWKTAAAFGGFGALNLALIVPFFFGASPSPTPGATTIRAAVINVNTANTRGDLVCAFVREHKPDIILFEEVDEVWDNRLAPLRDEYEHWESELRGDNFGIALASRLPWKTAKIVHLGEAGVPSVTATFEVGGRVLTVLGTHPVPPSGKQGSRLRNDQIAAIARFMREQDQPFVLIGDLNATPWSHHFRKLVRETGLRDSARGFGVQPTWPSPVAWLPVPSVFLRVPIDHCLVSSDVRVVRRIVGESVGSDHFPLLVELEL